MWREKEDAGSPAFAGEACPTRGWGLHGVAYEMHAQPFTRRGVSPYSQSHPMSSMRSVWLLNVETVPESHLVAATALQGLANRSGPQVYLHVTNRHWAMTLNPALQTEALRGCSDIWLDYYSKTHSLEFTPVPNLEALLGKVQPDVAGVIRFTLDQRSELTVAITLAGLRNAIPVTDDLLRDCPAFAALPVVEDLRGRFPDALEGQRWAARTLLPECNRHAMFSQTRTMNEGDPDYFSFDVAIEKRMFVFNLDLNCARSPGEFALAEEVMCHLEPGSPIYGWGTSEATMMLAMAKSGSFLVCTHTPNISFHGQIKPTAALPFKQKRASCPPTLEKKYYVSFLVNEGDTLKWMGSVMGHGQWLQPQRGQLPINWGINAWLVENYPGLMELFYSTMTENDQFYSAITGYGYYNPKLSKATELLARQETEKNTLADLRVGSIYSVHNMIDATNGILDDATDRWLTQRGCDGYAFEAAQQADLKWTRSGQPVIGVDWSLFYWWFRAEGRDPIQAAAERIREIAKTHEPPFFIPVYGGSPAEFKALSDHLPPDAFTIVSLEDMIHLAKQAGPEAGKPRPLTTASRASPDRPATSQAPLVIQAPYFNGTALYSAPVDHDLSRWSQGRCKVRYRWAWNNTGLQLRIEEVNPPAKPYESHDGRCYGAGEFDSVDGVAFWMDFDGHGTCEKGGFTPWLGFSRVGRSDLYCCQLNNRTLTSPRPAAVVTTSEGPGERRIEAMIPWQDLATYLAPEYQPEGGLLKAIRPGFRFGCQPFLIEGCSGRAYLNGRSNKRQDTTAATLSREGGNDLLPPSGFDSDSLWIELA